LLIFWLVFVKKKMIVEDLAIKFANREEFPIGSCVIVHC